MTRSVLLLATFAIGCSSEPIVREYRTITALADGSSLVTWQDKGRSFGVGRVDRSGHFKWVAELEGRPEDMFLHHGLVVADHLVALRTRRRDGSDKSRLLEAIALDDGRRAWKSVLRTYGTESATGDGLDANFIGFATKQAIRPFLKSGKGHEGELLEIDPVSGRERRRAPLPVQWAHTPLALGEEVVVHGLDSKAFVIGSDTMLVESRGVGCIVDDDYWHLVRTEDRWEMLATRDQARRPIPVEAVVPDRELALQGCAAYRDAFVLFVRVNGSSEVRVVDREGNVLRRIVALGR